LVVAAGSVLGLLGLFAVGSRGWLGTHALEVRVGFDAIRGVEVGTRVRIQGIDAGEVAAIEPPAGPGEPVVLCLRLRGDYRHLVLSGSTVHIENEGLIGAKVLEIDSAGIKAGTPAADPVADGATLRSRPAVELSDTLAAVNSTLQSLRGGDGTLGKLVYDPKAYQALVALLEQGKETMTSFRDDAEALKRLPVVRGYVEDPVALLVRPRCERNRQVFATCELFEPGRAVLTGEGRRRLDELAPWLEGLKHKGSDVVVVAFADPRTAGAQSRNLTRQQSEAVVDYLQQQHAVQKLGWFRSRKVTPLGLGTSSPPVPETGPLPPSRLEVVVFVPQ
jgi:phospholipid/cholesterol/gamma-HCH transport system substrate-binding protein